jgi:DNA end-binding protein Ku
MAARAISSGTISFGLVAIPVKLYTAASSQSVSFNMLHAKCGSRLKQQYICPTDQEVVDRNDSVKGYEYAKDQYVRFTPEEIKALESERTNTLDIVEFVPASTVDFIYIEKTYYLGPDKGGHKAYHLLSEAMTRAGKIAVGRFMTRGKEQLVLVRPYKKGLVLHEVFYANEVRAFDDLDTTPGIELKDAELGLAEKLIDQLTEKSFDSAKYDDTYAKRVLAAVEQKVAGQEITIAPEQPTAQIIDLFEALKKSLEGGAKPAAGAGEPAAAAAPAEGSEDQGGLRKVAPEKEKSAGRKKRSAG